MTRRKQSSHSATEKRRIKPLAAFGVTLLITLTFVVAFFFWKYTQVSGRVRLDPVQEKLVRSELDPAPVPEASKEPAQYVLFLGGDMRPGQTKGRSDTIIVARIDPIARKIAMLSIPRDTRVDIPGRGKTKINAAMAYGGPALAISTVKQHTGLPINHFVFLDFRGFADIVDMMGGVWIDVDRPIDDENGDTVGGISRVTHIDAGRQRLDGKQALTYVRSRKYADGDFTRIRNQQAFIKAVAKQALDGSNVDKLSGMVDVLSGNVKSDMDLMQMSELARLFKGVSDESVVTTTLPGVPRSINGVSYVVPDLAARDRIVASFKQGLPAE